MVKLIIATLFVMVLAATAASVIAQSDVEVYRVYDAVIAEMFKDGKVTFDTQAAVKMYVINDMTTTDTTTTAYSRDEQKENWDRVKQGLPKLSDELIKAYESKLKPATKLETGFVRGLKYVLVSDAAFGVYSLRRQEWWTTFYKNYPDSGGFITFSNVAFTPDGNQALVYFVHWCGETCGTGHYLLLNKSSIRWTVVNRAEMWIS